MLLVSTGPFSGRGAGCQLSISRPSHLEGLLATVPPKLSSIRRPQGQDFPHLMSGQVECLDATPQQGPKILSDGKDHGWGQNAPHGTEALAPDTGLCPLLRAHEFR